MTHSTIKAYDFRILDHDEVGAVSGGSGNGGFCRTEAVEYKVGDLGTLVVGSTECEDWPGLKMPYVTFTPAGK